MNEDVLSVGELTGLIKETLEGSFRWLRITGEISNFKEHTSGHRYFSLKDELAQISCTMWKSRTLAFIPEDGMKVIISGAITVYPPRGSYQVDCYSIEAAGKGELFIAFEKLKEKLEAKGYFDLETKAELPDLPLKIGISTSLTGAALQDMLSTIRRRAPFTEVIVRPTIVQGAEAPADIAAAIGDLEALAPDLIIIGRGGGSIEDLWAYNTELVADRIFSCTVPVISAVGHETDFTIADFTADRRAATPTAAAEMATPRTITDLDSYLGDSIAFMKQTASDTVGKQNLFLRFFEDNLKPKRFLDNVFMKGQRIDELQDRLSAKTEKNLERARRNLDKWDALIRRNDPALPLRKGFAIIRKNEKMLGANESIESGDNIEIIRLRQNSTAVITNSEDNKNGR